MTTNQNTTDLRDRLWHAITEAEAAGLTRHEILGELREVVTMMSEPEEDEPRA